MVNQIKKRLAYSLIVGTFVFPMFSIIPIESNAREQKSVINEPTILSLAEEQGKEEEELREENPIVTTSPIELTDNITMQKPMKEPKKEKYLNGWVSASKLNIRKSPSKKSKIIGSLLFNEKISYIKVNKSWVKIKYKKNYAYIAKKYISKTKLKYKQYEIPSYGGFKSWMPHTLKSGRSIFCKSSPQYKLQQKAYTGAYGIRMVDGRYCVAIGSHFITKIGTYFDLVLENGEIIPCILGDQKANKDTDSNNIFTVHSQCCSEFIIDREGLNYNAKRDGNISSVSKEWSSRVKYIRVYK